MNEYKSKYLQYKNDPIIKTFIERLVRIREYAIPVGFHKEKGFIYNKETQSLIDRTEKELQEYIDRTYTLII